MEDDPAVVRWLKPHQGIDIIFYKDNRSYTPDFIVEAQTQMYLIEVKRESDIRTEEVQEKARTAEYWCKIASEWAEKNNQKIWTYLLIPHDQIDHCKTLERLAAEYSQTVCQ